MAKQDVSTKGINKGKNRLGLPNNQELNQMSNDELNAVLTQTRQTMMTAKGNQSKGLNPPGGNLRELRRVTARILTIQQKRGI